MKTVVAILGLLTSHALLGVEDPGIAAGDYLLVYARIDRCGSELQAIEAAHVGEDGVLTVFGDVSLVAKDKPVHQVRNDLVDEMERRTGHRSQTLKLVHVPGGDKEAAVKHLIRFSGEVKSRCPRRDLRPVDPDEDWVKTFETFVNSVRTTPHRPAAMNTFGAPIREVS